MVSMKKAPLGEHNPLLGDRVRVANTNELKTACIPWVFFVCAGLAFTLGFHHSPGFLTCLSLFVLSLLLLRAAVASGAGLTIAPYLLRMLPRSASASKAAAALAGRSPGGDHATRLLLTCALAVAIGSGVGYYNYRSTVDHYWAYFERRHYTNVWPEEPAAAHADASAITFAAGSRPEVAHAGGLQAGSHTYCVAPVHVPGAAAVASARVEYWAIGRDCCIGGMRRESDAGHFSCGDASDDKARAGLVFYNRPDGYLLAGTSLYAKAARMVAAQYGLKSASDPIWVIWTSDLDRANFRRVGDALLFLLYASIIALPFLAVLELGAKRTQGIGQNALAGVTRRRAMDISALGMNSSPFHPATAPHPVAGFGVRP
jgi:hypothetical protein